jgi:hypothetical protein
MNQSSSPLITRSRLSKETRPPQSLTFGDHINDIHNLRQRIKTLESDSMYEIITFNLVFLVILGSKLRHIKKQGV